MKLIHSQIISLTAIVVLTGFIFYPSIFDKNLKVDEPQLMKVNAQADENDVVMNDVRLLLDNALHAYKEDNDTDAT